MYIIESTKDLERKHDLLIGNNAILGVKIRKLQRKIDSLEEERRKNFIAAHDLKIILLNRPEYSVKEEK